MNCIETIQRIPTTCSSTLLTLSPRIVAADKSKDLVMVTESENLVSIFELKTGQTVRSWSFDELNKLRIPFAIRSLSDEPTFVGVHSGNYLREWRVDEKKELQKVAQRKLNLNIVALISSSASIFDTVVVFENGAANFLENVNTSLNERSIIPVLGRGHEIIQIESYTTSPTNLGLIYFTRFKEHSNQIGICKLILSKNNPEPKITKFTIDQTFDVYGCMMKKHLAVGLSKVKNKIEMYEFKDKNTKEVITTYGGFDFERVQGYACSNNGTVCLLGEKANTYYIEVYDNQYSSKIGHLYLQEEVSPKDLTIINNNIMIVCTNFIIVASFVQKKILLSKMLTIKPTFIAQDLLEDNPAKSRDVFKVFLNNISKREFNLALVRETRVNFNDKYVKQSKRSMSYNMPEEIIAFLFGWTTKYLLEYSKNINAEDHDDIVKELTQLFFELVNVPFNNIFLHTCMAYIDIKREQYLLAVEILLKEKTSIINNCSTLMWLSFILDHNANEFVLKPNNQELDLMMEVRDLILTNIEFYQKSDAIKVILDTLLRVEKEFLNKISGKKVSIGQYSIEMLSFS